MSTPRALAAYADNLYFVSRSAGGAALILDDAAAQLAERWSLGVKAGSREMVVADGADGGAPTGWTVAAQMSVLGAIFSSNGYSTACIDRTLHQAWRAFWANCERHAARGLAQQARFRLLQRCVWPIIAFRTCRWQRTAVTRRGPAVSFGGSRRVQASQGTLGRR